MKRRERVHSSSFGFSLVEVMVAMTIMVIAALGALGYQYYAVQHSKIAEAQIAATRTAQLLLEDWKSTGGSTDYDPTTLGLGFSSADEDDFDYTVIIDELPMYIALSHNDVAHDSAAGITLRKIVVKVRWRKDFGEGQVEDDDPLLVMTTYVRLDAAGG